jgi:hypothetical protein
MIYSDSTVFKAENIEILNVEPSMRIQFSVFYDSVIRKAGRIGSIKKSNDLIRIRTRDLPACGIVPQTTIPHALKMFLCLTN